MYISAKAAAENLNTYQSFKDQLLPNIKKGNVAVLYPQGCLPEAKSSIGIGRRSKRSKTSFDSHNNSRTSSATGANSTFIQEQINRSRQTSRCGGFSRKASKSGDCTPFISIDQNVFVKPQIIKKSLRTLNNTDQCLDENHKLLKLPSATTKSHITLIDLDDSTRLKKTNDPIPIDRQPKLNSRVNNLSVVDVQAPSQQPPTHHPVLSQQTHRAAQMLMQDTNQDLNGLLLLSMYDQSDNKSQTCYTVNAENQLREENMQLRMEIIKLKKALFMKSQNAMAIDYAQELRNKSEQMMLRNHLEEGAIKEPQMTPLTRVVTEEMCEEGVSSYSHEDLPRLANSHMTFKQIQHSSSSRQYDPDAVVTFQPQNHHNQSAQALDDLEQMLRDQGINVREDLIRNPKEFLLTDERKGLSSVFEQKRHYEQEIEVLKKDLEVIESEEQKIKQRISEQSSILIESIKLERGQINREKSARQSKEAIQGGFEINVAFDSFLEKRSINQPKFLPVGSSIDKFSLNCISDDGVMPTVSINHQNISHNNKQHQWLPPSFSNSLFPSTSVSPVNTNNLVQQQPLQISQQTQVGKARGRRSRYSQKKHQNTLICNESRSNDASQTSQEELPIVQQQPSYQPNNGQTSSRLNTDMIDQLFEDPKLQSQFQCLDNDQPIISLLSVGHEFPKKKQSNIEMAVPTSFIKANDHHNNFIVKNSQERQEQQKPQKLTHIKQTLKGVLQTYEQSFQKNSNQVRHFIGDGTESKFSPKKEFGIPRLSTIKEDSPEFGPFTENSDIVNHSSILRHQIQNNSQMSYSQSNAHNNQPCEMCQRQQNTSGHRSNAPSFEQNQIKTMVKKSSQMKVAKQVSKSPLRPTHSANQLNVKKGIKTNFIKITKPAVQQHPHISRSSSPYNTNQVSNIVNQAYKDIIKRKQREAQEISYISTRINQQAVPMTYAGLAQMTQQKKNLQMKNNKHQGAQIVAKKPKKAKENIKFLSNIVNKMQGSRNGQQNKVISSNMNQSSSAVSSYSFISAKAKQPRTPISHPRSLSNQSKQQRPSPIGQSNLHCIEEQYDLLWSKQVKQKRISLLKKKEEAAKQKYQEKLAKIESIQRKKAFEIEERKNKSKSPSNYVATTTMSEFECTPSYGMVGMKMTFDKGYNQGYNTVQPPTMIPSSSTRSPKLPSTPLINDCMANNYHNIHTKPSQAVTVTASGITTNLISQQSSAGKPIIRSSRTPEVAKGTGSTPVTVNKNYWDNNPEMSSEDQRWYAANGGCDFINSSANTTAIVTAINGMNYENLGTLRQQVPFHNQIGSPLQQWQQPVSIRHTAHHSHSNSGQKITTEKRIYHKKQSSLSDPKTQSATQIDMQVNARPSETRHHFIQKKQESDLMRQFLSNNNHSQQNNQSSQVKSGNQTMRSQNNFNYQPSLLQLHPVKYDGKTQVKALPLNKNVNEISQHMRLLEPIFEDY